MYAVQYEHMDSFLSPANTDILLKLFIALCLGMTIGVERIYAHKTAGMRTYARRFLS